MKYIDAEEITPIMAEYVADVFSRKNHLDNISYGYCMEIADVFRRYAERAKQPEESKKDCNGCPHCVDRKDQYGWHFKGCFGGPYNGKFIAEIDECPLKQEQPSLPDNLKLNMTRTELELNEIETLTHLVRAKAVEPGNFQGLYKGILSKLNKMFDEEYAEREKKEESK